MLRAVPNQAVQHVTPREDAFQRAVENAMDLPGPEAVTAIMNVYSGDVRALLARVEGLQTEASEQAAEKRRFFNMLTQVQMAASHKLWEGAKMGAELATYKEMVDAVRHYVHQADGQPVLWETLAAVLAMEPLEPVHRPVTLAFLPSEQYRGAQFASELGDVTFVFTFIGWSLVDHGPGAYGIVEPMFLVEDKAMTRSAIETERHVKMEAFLPALERVA